MAFDQLLSILQHSASRGSRSTALQPLGWLLALLIVLFISCLKYQAPVWVSCALLSTTVSSVFVYLGVYIFLINTNPDATRSEKFVIEKMQIQQSRTGDDISGFRVLTPLVDRQAAPVPVSDISATTDSPVNSQAGVENE
jgi:hypothetical protein